MPQPPIDPRYLGHNAPLRKGAIYIGGAAAVVIASLWLFFGKSDARIYNPGPLSGAHAMLEHQCAACHKPAEKGSFRQPVGDAACLHCHDGAVHHHNQIDFVAKDLARPEPLRQRSANCASCHQEHRGRAALAAVSDEHCLRCHRNLPASTSQPAELKLQPSVISFAAGGQHPQFGRQLLQGGARVDPTVLKFNHRLHLDLESSVPHVPELQCYNCHSTASPNRLTPTTLPYDPPSSWANDRDRAYMQPISYARHCQKCHALELYPGGPVLAHTALPLVKGQLANVTALLTQKLGAAPSASQPATSPAESQPAPAPPPEVTEGIEKLEDALDAATQSQQKIENHSITTRPSSDPAVLEWYVAKRMTNNCFRCHSLDGNLEVTSAAAAAATPAKTVSTGIVATRRRWYTNSFFNHDAHRNEPCLTCHSAIRSGPTKEKLGNMRTEKPDEWDPIERIETKRLNLPGIENCVSCHHADNRAERGAGVNCVTCHFYHDRSLEWIERAPTTQPIVMLPPNP